MKTSILTVLYIQFIYAQQNVPELNSTWENKMYKREWGRFKVWYGRVFQNSDEENRRFQLFRGQLKDVMDHNARYQKGEVSYSISLNRFADWIGALEGHFALRNGALSVFSEQDIVDCSRNISNFGCRGGSTRSTFEYMRTKGVPLQSDYPWDGKDGSCRKRKSGYRAFIRGYVQIPKRNEYAMQLVVANLGPITVSFNGNFKNFQFYREGIYSDPRCTDTNILHSLTVIGYGTERNGVPYWIVKNSWGPDWGQGGFGRVLRSKDMCGISRCAYYPVIY